MDEPPARDSAALDAQQARLRTQTAEHYARQAAVEALSEAEMLSALYRAGHMLPGALLFWDPLCTWRDCAPYINQCRISLSPHPGGSDLWDVWAVHPTWPNTIALHVPWAQIPRACCVIRLLIPKEATDV